MASEKVRRLEVLVAILAAAGLADLLVLDAVLAPLYLEERAAAAATRPEGRPRAGGRRLAEAPLVEAPGPSGRRPEAPGPGRPPDLRAGGGAASPAERPAARPEDRTGRGAASPAERPAAGPEDRGGGGPLPPAAEPLVFEPGSAELDGEARRRLWTVVWVMRRQPEVRLLARAHADGSRDGAGAGPARRRAEAAVRFLVERGGLDRSRLEVEVVERAPSRRGSRAEAPADRRVDLLWR